MKGDQMKTLKKLATVAWLAILLTLSVYGRSISYDDAKDVAVNYIYSAAGEKVAAVDSGRDILGTSEAFHVVALKPKGWVIVSGDDRVKPVVAWSLESPLSTADFLPAGFLVWLKNAERQIREVKNSDEKSDAAIQEEWDRLTIPPDDYISESETANKSSTITKGPLLTSKWAQSGYFNNRCPGNSNGEQALTGSAAIAMAQIMNYHKWPSVGMGSHSYTSKTNGFDLSVKFGKITYKWKDMSNDDIAKIIYHTGVAVDMDYDYTGSNANTDRIATALRKYFRYNSGDFEKRSDQNSTAWQSKIKKSIDIKLPIIYYNNNGNDEKNHFFVVDGYSTSPDDTTYHINWGEEGVADGWYRLDGLISDDSGSGYGQGAVFGVSAAGAMSTDGYISNTPIPPVATKGTYSDHVHIQYNYPIGIYYPVRIMRSASAGSMAPLTYIGTLGTHTNSLDAKCSSDHYYRAQYVNVSVNPTDFSNYSLTDEGWCKGSTPPVPPRPPVPPKPPAPPAPTKPSCLASNGTYYDGVLITSSRVAGAVKYRLYRSSSFSGYMKFLGANYTGRFVDRTAKVGESYYYAVKGCDSSGKCSGFSNYDSGWVGRLATPAMRASKGTFDDYTIVITAKVKGATKYRLYRSKSFYGQMIYLGTNYTGTFADATGAAIKIYYYAVKACNDNGCSYLSPYDRGWRSSPIPKKPTNVRAGNGTSYDYVAISYNAVIGADKYKLWRLDSFNGPTTYLGARYSGTFIDKTAEMGKTYYYTIKACNKHGCGELSDYDKGWRAKDPSHNPPATPSTIQASNGTYSGRVIINSYTVFGASKYRLYRSETFSGSMIFLGATTSATFEDKTAEVGKIYYYAIRACNNYGCSAHSDYDRGWVGRSSNLAPAQPTGLSASNGTYEYKVAIKINPVYGATKYRLYRSTSFNGEIKFLGASYSNRLNDLSAESGRTYYYAARACNDKACSALSNYDTGYRMTPKSPAAPTTIQATKGTYNGRVIINSYTVYGATKYRLYRSETFSGSMIFLGATTSATLVDTTGERGKRYYYSVRACNNYGCSAMSRYEKGWSK